MRKNDMRLLLDTHTLDILEDLEDIQAVNIAGKDNSERMPLEMVEKIAAGENAIKTFREYRGVSQKEVAEYVGISKQYISQIENGERCGTVKILKKIAKFLKIDLEDIT